jgi:hypothetical protein
MKATNPVIHLRYLKAFLNIRIFCERNPAYTRRGYYNYNILDDLKISM